MLAGFCLRRALGVKRAALPSGVWLRRPRGWG